MKKIIVLVLVVIALAAGGGFWLKAGNPNALRHIVLDQCVPGQMQNRNPAPCALVKTDAGYVVFKDRNGPLQYLLMPSAKITGIESPAVLDAATPNFFAQAWRARHVMAERYGKPIDDGDISLAINSEYGRTQNQLHIHISCLLPAVKQRLTQIGPDFINQWQPLPGGLLGHDYLGRRVTPAELEQQGAFRLLAAGLPRADGRMGSFGLAMTALPDGDFLLLATERSLLPFTLASAEELQDHDCRLLTPPPRA